MNRIYSPLPGRARASLRTLVRIDTRSLALFRIALGSLAIADVLLRARNFGYFYTDDGVVPRSLAMELTPDFVPSIFHLSTNPTVILLLFAVHALVAAQLVVGYRTRIATLLTLLFVVSLDLRNPLVLSYADVLFQLLLFWALFLPLGERWSVDAVRADEHPRQHVAGVASALLLLQPIAMYFFNGLQKTKSETWADGEAAVLVLGLDDTTFLLGDFVREFPTLLQFGGVTWYYMLLFSWLLLLLRGRKRALLVSAFVAGHLAFALTVRIGAFPYVAIAGLLPFVQSEVWADGKRLANGLAIDTARYAVFASGLERFARRSSEFSLPTGPLGVPTGSLEVAARPLETTRTAVYDAALGVAVLLFVLLTVVSLLHVGVVGGDGGPEQRIDAGAAIAGIDPPDTSPLDPLDWSIFAPEPRTTDRYYVFPARTADGDVIDAYNERPLTYERPSGELQAQFGTYRERFYMTELRHAESDAPRAALAEYLCSTWRDEHGVEITHVNMYQVTETVTLETIDRPADRDREYVLFYSHGCGDDDPEEISPPDDEGSVRGGYLGE